MTISKTPGVYVQENLSPLAPVTSTSGVSIAAFIGSTGRGPLGAKFVGSWSAFTNIYGAFGDATQPLPFAVWAYFANGGRGCYVSRAINANAVTATVNLDDVQSSPETAIKVDCIAPGLWGNSASIGVKKLANGRFDLIVRYGGAAESNVVERFADVSLDPADPRYCVSIVNSVVSGSGYVRVTNVKAASPPWTYNPSEDSPAEIANASLASGTDGTGTPDRASALRGLDQVDENLVVNFPAESSSTVINDGIVWAEQRGTAFIVVDGPQATAGSNSDAVTAVYLAMVSGGSAISVTSYGAIYGPWLAMTDPSSSVPGAMRMVAPGGAVLGKYAQVEANRGIAKTPAGTETRLSGVLDLEARFTMANTDALADAAINVIRLVTGAGFCIMGGRTLRDGYPDRYISIRRTLGMLRRDLTSLTRFAIFEPNDDALWNLITRSITQYLNGLMQQGVLKGSTESEAFFVKCDGENNLASTVAVGRVNVTVGVALRGPAEYIVITIGQYDGGVDVSATV